MLNKDANSETIQAFPVHSKTFVGTATNRACAKKAVHLAVNGDITFHFVPGDVVFTDLIAPVDFTASADCTGVTSTAEIWVG